MSNDEKKHSYERHRYQTKSQREKAAKAQKRPKSANLKKLVEALEEERRTKNYGHDRRTILQRSLSGGGEEYRQWAAKPSVFHHEFVRGHKETTAYVFRNLYGKDGPGESDRAYSRCFTVIWELIDVDDTETSHQQVKDSCKALKQAMANVCETGNDVLGMIGAIEIEIVNIRQFEMNQTIRTGIPDQSAQKGSKLRLWRSRQEVMQGRKLVAKSQAMIHMHGAIETVKIGAADGIRERWIKEVNQRSDFGDLAVEVKRWAETWKGKSKPLEKNIMEWAAYAAKGGNDHLKFNSKWGRSVENMMGDDWAVGDDYLTDSEVRWLHRAYLELVGESSDDSPGIKHMAGWRMDTKDATRILEKADRRLTRREYQW